MSPLSILLIFIQILALIAAVFFGVLAGDEHYFILAMIGGGAAILFCALRPGLTAFATVALYLSGLTAPGLPLEFNFFRVFSLLTLFAEIIQAAYRRLPRWEMSATYGWIVGFIFVIGMTILFRGSGLRAFGSEMWGGLIYVELFLAIALAFALPFAPLTPRQWRAALLTMSILSALPILSDIVVLHTGRADIWSFIQGSGQINSTYLAQESGAGLMRFFSAAWAGFYLLFAFLLFSGTRGMFHFSRLPFLFIPALCVAMMLLSGHRIAILQSFLLIGFLMWIQRAFTTRNCIILLTAAFLLLAAAIHWSRALPESGQRALSFIPGMQIEKTARSDAEATVEWRIELWQRAWQTFPRYWLIGRGCAFSAKELQPLIHSAGDENSLEVALVIGSYHNGPLTLLLSFGVLGFLTGSGFLLGGSLRHYRLTRRPWHDPILQQCHQTIAALMLMMSVVFFAVYGDVRSLIPFLFFLGIAEALRVRDRILAVKTVPG